MDKEEAAIGRLRQASEMSLLYYKKPLVVTTSGGKDSSVCVELALRAGIPFEVMHNHTTADAPETVRFVRSEFKRLEEKGITCILNMPTYKGERTSMWKLIPQKKIPPTRNKRYCCEVLKEHGGSGRFLATGVRWDESKSREKGRGVFEKNSKERKTRIILMNDNDDKRRLFETCSIRGKRTVNPIIDWSDDEVWDFIGSQHIRRNPLYADGFDRVGCIGCPLANKCKREREFLRWPGYKRAYVSAFDRMLDHIRSLGLDYNGNTYGHIDWQTGDDVFNWWMEYDVLPGQMDILEEET